MILKGLFDRYPGADFFLTVRNFNNLLAMTVFGLNIEGRGEDQRAYVCLADITPFIPEVILLQLKKAAEETPNGLIPFPAFGQLGDALAKAMGRKVLLTHMFGSGRQEEADYTHFEFKP
ncbi:MAG: hypothetical protein V1846_00755 [Candidatus Komeilibacteria bacterium]